ncbi:hypothetical protein ACLQ2R_17505 [Streptosporangium sp. DT93]|uniref:hypothetical protein n=1 Tax=Streptosporangium sp. DT93 TaxID=3393428 RepID=UPI003CF27E00
MTRTLVPAGQDLLWDLDPIDDLHGAPSPQPRHTPRPDPTRDEIQAECEPACLGCGKPEGRGLCSRCMVVCTRLPANEVADVCVVTTRVLARLAVGIHGHEPGRKLAVVDCPHCDRLHWHTPLYGTHYRVPPCRQPYIVILPRPRIDPRTGLSSTQTGERGRMEYQGAPCDTRASQATTAPRSPGGSA